MELGSAETDQLGSPWATNDELGSDVSDDLRERVKRELEPGERPLWASKADPPSAPLGAKFFVGLAAVPALILLALACYANGMGHLGPPARANEPAPIFMGIVASTLASALASGLFVNWTNRRVEKRRMAKTCYAVTDQRAILWIPDTKTVAVRVISVHRGEFQKVVRAELPGGSGDLEISPEHYVGHLPWHPFSFRNVPDVRRVEQIVRKNLITNLRAEKRSEQQELA